MQPDWDRIEPLSTAQWISNDFLASKLHFAQSHCHNQLENMMAQQLGQTLEVVTKKFFCMDSCGLIQTTLRSWPTCTFGHVPSNGASVCLMKETLEVCLAWCVRVVGITFCQENLLHPRFWQIGVISLVVAATDATDSSLRFKDLCRILNSKNWRNDLSLYHSIFSVCFSVWPNLIHHQHVFFWCDHLGQPSVAGGCHHLHSIYVVTTWTFATQLLVAQEFQTIFFGCYIGKPNQKSQQKPRDSNWVKP